MVRGPFAVLEADAEPCCDDSADMSQCGAQKAIGQDEKAPRAHCP